MKNFTFLKNNKTYQSETKIVINNPENNQPVGFVYGMNKSELNDVFAAAHKAFVCYQHTPLLKKVAMMKKWADILESRADEMAHVMSQEIAKGINSAKKEVIRSVDYIRLTVEQYLKMQPEAFTNDATTSDETNKSIAFFERSPLGVILAISPFNYPVNLAVTKIAPALITGNTVVLKPPTVGCLTTTLLAETLHDAGFTNNIFNLAIIRGRDAGDSLVNNEHIKVINFTGSYHVGHNLAEKSKFAQLIMELGGKDPALVLNDADPNFTAKKIAAGAYSYSGQRCTAIKRVLVQDKIADELVKCIAQEVSKLTVGSASQNMQITPVVDHASVEITKKLLQDALDKGAKKITGGKITGNLIEPILVDHVTTEMDLATVEPFAPILPIMRINDPEQMIEIANASEYGLQAAVFTKDINFALALSKKIKAGTVHVNSFSERGPDYFPFVGIKHSGMNAQGVKNALLSVTTPHGIVIHYNSQL